MSKHTPTTEGATMKVWLTSLPFIRIVKQKKRTRDN